MTGITIESPHHIFNGEVSIILYVLRVRGAEARFTEIWRIGYE